MQFKGLKELGSFLKSFRKKNTGLTVSQLGEDTGIGQSGLSRIEAGKTDIRISTLDKIVRAMGKRLHITIE